MDASEGPRRVRKKGYSYHNPLVVIAAHPHHEGYRVWE